MAIEPEGAESTLVQDSSKYRCPFCGGVEFMISTTLDEPTDVTEDTVYAALYMTSAGTNDILGLVVLCSQCGKESVPWWICIDQCTGAAGAAVTLTDMVTTSAADLLAGCYAIYVDDQGTDTGLYYTVTTNTKADPTVLTMTIATNNDEKGAWIITNLAPTGWTAAS